MLARGLYQLHAVGGALNARCRRGVGEHGFPLFVYVGIGLVKSYGFARRGF